LAEKFEAVMDESEVGEYFRDDVIPFSMEHFLGLVDKTNHHCEDDECDDH